MAVLSSRLYAGGVNATRKRAGRRGAVAPMERTVLSGLVHHPERDAPSRIIVPASPGPSTLSAGVVASGFAAIGPVAIRDSAECRTADSLWSRSDPPIHARLGSSVLLQREIQKRRYPYRYAKVYYTPHLYRWLRVWRNEQLLGIELKPQ